jgi:hypothetical protein
MRNEARYLNYAEAFSFDLKSLLHRYSMSIKVEELRDGSPELVFEHPDFRIASGKTFNSRADLGEIEFFTIADYN